MEQLPLPGTMSSAKPSRRHSIAVALRQNIIIIICVKIEHLQFQYK